jgi:hypothetical protein
LDFRVEREGIPWKGTTLLGWTKVRMALEEKVASKRRKLRA